MIISEREVKKEFKKEKEVPKVVTAFGSTVVKKDDRLN
jgi:hypothetical protein